jgi:hypothetical protein
VEGDSFDSPFVRSIPCSRDKKSLFVVE